MSDKNLTTYYAERANEYDNIYLKPERQADIRRLSECLTHLLEAKEVLEIACGTGFWTQTFGPKANCVLATDFNSEVLQIAKYRLVKHSNIKFRKADAYVLDNVAANFNAALSAFWWSHIEIKNIPPFLNTLHTKLRAGSGVVFCDNLYVEGSSTPISREDDAGNTYQNRVLSDGRIFEVLKNFPSEQAIRKLLEPSAKNIEFRCFDYFWCAWYNI